MLTRINLPTPSISASIAGRVFAFVRHHVILLQCVALACATLAPSVANAARWPTLVRTHAPYNTAWLSYQARLDHNAVFPASHFKAAWTVLFSKKINGGLAIVDGVLYTDNFDGTLYALNLHDGYTLWKAHVGKTLMSTPVVSDNIVIVGSGDNDWFDQHGNAIYAFSAHDGRLLWKFPTLGEDMVSPAIDGTRVIFANGDKHAYALDLHTGRLLWKRALSGIAAMDSIMVHEGKAFIGTCNATPVRCHTYALDARSGRIIWKNPLGSGDPSPTVSDGLVITGSLLYDDDHYYFGGNNVVAALSERTGQTVWTYTGEAGPCTKAGSDEHEIAGTVADRTLFQSLGCNSQVVALDLRTGALLWSFRTAAPVKMSPVIYHGRIYFGDTTGVLYVLDEPTGHLLRSMSFTQPFTTSAPVIVGQTLIIANSVAIYAVPLDLSVDPMSLPVYIERNDVPQHITDVRQHTAQTRRLHAP